MFRLKRIFIALFGVVCVVTILRLLVNNIVLQDFKASTSIEVDKRFKTLLTGKTAISSKEPKTYIITGASDNHFRSMVRLIRQVAERMGAYNIELIVVDLGLRQENRDQLFSEAFRIDLETRGANFGVKFFKFDFENHSKWISNLHTYAWKPLSIRDVILQFGAEKILWLDAGDVINRRFSPGAWEDYWKTVSVTGMAIPELGDCCPIRKWTDPGMLKYFHVVPNSPILDQHQFTSAILAFDLRVKGVKSRIVDPWVDCALRMECFAPRGSSLRNHRYDQAALSIILKRENWPKDQRLVNENYRFISVHEDIG
eukprot:42084_1